VAVYWAKIRRGTRDMVDANSVSGRERTCFGRAQPELPGGGGSKNESPSLVLAKEASKIKPGLSKARGGGSTVVTTKRSPQNPPSRNQGIQNR